MRWTLLRYTDIFNIHMHGYRIYTVFYSVVACVFRHTYRLASINSVMATFPTKYVFCSDGTGLPPLSVCDRGALTMFMFSLSNTMYELSLRKILFHIDCLININYHMCLIHKIRCSQFHIWKQPAQYLCRERRPSECLKRHCSCMWASKDDATASLEFYLFDLHQIWYYFVLRVMDLDNICVYVRGTVTPNFEYWNTELTWS